jgi:hypothetical protein
MYSGFRKCGILFFLVGKPLNLPFSREIISRGLRPFKPLNCPEQSEDNLGVKKFEVTAKSPEKMVN